MKNKILLNIEQPPPMHGMTYINKIIYEHLKDDERFVFYDTNFTLDVKEVGGFSFKKVAKNVFVIAGAWKSFLKVRPTSLYTILSASKFGIVRDFLVNLPALVFGKQMVYHLHGFTYYKIYQESKVYKFLFKLMTKNSSLIVLCEKQKDITFDVMQKDSTVIYNCLHQNSKISKKLKNKVIQLCYISNISKQKGTFELIKAVKNYDEKIKLVIAGNFLSDKEEFFELIDESDNISYLGFADEKLKEKILKESDIFCLPSKLEEGSPISIIEAMSYALPVIATDKGCIKDMVGSAGKIVQNEIDIKKAIREIEGDYINLSNISIEKYKQNYSNEVFVKEFKKTLLGEIKNVQK